MSVRRRTRASSSSTSSARSPRASSSIEERVSSGRMNVPSTVARLAPARTVSERARPPRSICRAVASRVFPAPVSPVIAFSPGDSSRVASSIRATFSTEISVNTTGKSSARLSTSSSLRSGLF